MKINNVEIIYHDSTDIIDEVRKNIERDNKKASNRESILFAICFILWIVQFIVIITIFYNNDNIDSYANFTIFVFLSILCSGGIYFICKFILISKGYDFFSEHVINPRLELSHILKQRNILCYDCENNLLIVENESKEVENIYIPNDMKIVDRTDLKDKVILDINKEILFKPYVL